jgi:hypothetical protein
MGRVRIPFYRVKNGNGFWEPKPYMRAAGMVAVPCGPDGPQAWTKAMDMTAEWERRKGEAAPVNSRGPLRGSLDEAFQRYRATPEWDKKALRTREEWERAWARIGPVLGDADPKKVTLEVISLFRADVESRVSTREAHRCIKIWRALWRVAAAQGYCQKDADPSFGVRNTEPQRRKELWAYLEAVALVKGAWRAGYRGLAALIAVAWDSSLSPVDARTLTPAQRHRDSRGDWFDVARAKTGRAAVATLSRPASRVLDSYLATLGADIAPRAALFRNRSGAPYSKDTLGDDFRAVRTMVFGEGERRTLADFRRSGAVEAIRGGADAEGIGNKLANDFKQSAFLQKTYAPVDLDTVRRVDEARRKGRRRVSTGAQT